MGPENRYRVTSPSESGGQGVRMDAECPGLWLKERKFSFKNFFLCSKRHWGRGRKGKDEIQEDFGEVERDTQGVWDGFVQGIPAPPAVRWQMIGFVH